MKPCVPPKLVMLCLRQLLHAVSDQTELYCWAKTSKQDRKGSLSINTFGALFATCYRFRNM